MSTTNPNPASSSDPTPTSSELKIGPPNPSNPPLLPWAFSNCPLDILVDLLTHMLELLIKHNDQVVLTPDALTRFHSRAAPGISVKDYLGRIVKYTNVEKIPLLSLLAYIDTTCTNLPTFTLSSLTVHRFLIASICAGSKAQCDVFCTNAHYAKVGGIKTQELNALERELLRVTKWDLCCHAEQLQKYYTSLIRSHGGYAQSPQPSIPPFLPFPRSRSKPRAVAPSPTPEGSVEPGEPEPPDEDDIMGEGESEDAGSDEGVEEDAEKEAITEDNDGGDQDGLSRNEGMIIDSSDPVANTTRGRTRIKETRPTSSSGLMDVDPTSPTTNEPENESPTSPYSNASSSVPSSSKSSIHRRSSIGSGSLRGRRSRLVSISESRIAEPKIDTTPAIVSPSSSKSAQSSGSPLNELARKISYSDMGNKRQGDLPSSSSTTTANGGHRDFSAPESSTKSTQSASISAPIPTPPRKSASHSLSSSHTSTVPSSSHDPKSHPHSYSHSSGKLLKSLVGGIFRRKSLPGDGNDHLSISQISTPPSTSSTPAIANNGNLGNKGKNKPPTQTQTQQHNIIPSKPIKSPRIPHHQKQSGISSSKPPSKSPKISTNSPRLYSPGSPQPVPGLAKPVTPKVRTRDETSLDPKDRVALGAPMSMSIPLGMSVGVGGGGDDVEGGKRSRIP